MSEVLIGECLCVPLVCDLPGVLAAWSLDGCPSCLARVNDRRVSSTVALGAADGLLGARIGTGTAQIGNVAKVEGAR